jgi:hypothetical protein
MQACAAGYALTYATTLKLQSVSSGFQGTCHNIIQVFAVEFRRFTHSSIMTSDVKESQNTGFKNSLSNQRFS